MVLDTADSLQLHRALLTSASTKGYSSKRAEMRQIVSAKPIYSTQTSILLPNVHRLQQLLLPTEMLRRKRTLTSVNGTQTNVRINRRLQPIVTAGRSLYDRRS